MRQQKGGKHGVKGSEPFCVVTLHGFAWRVSADHDLGASATPVTGQFQRHRTAILPPMGAG